MLYNANTNTLTFKGETIFNTIWGNVELRESLLNLSATTTKTPQEQFKDIVSDSSNSFYQFIKVK